MTPFQVKQHPEFSRWIGGIKDAGMKGIVAARLKRLQGGLFGDVKPVGEGVSELRIDYGPGYRVYFKRTGSTVIVLLVGGSKSTQDVDIVKAKRLASTLGTSDD